LNSVLVIGSSNTDMVIRIPTLPRPGETISGGEFQTFSGGKGANQAIAARRAGAKVTFIAAVGDDDLGRSAVDVYASEGVDISGIQVLTETASGVAFIFVSKDGENCIGVAPGANACLSADALLGQKHAFHRADILLLQLETPLDTVRTAIEIASRDATPVVLNPAPVARLPDDLLDGLFCITPNETEAEALSGVPVVDADSASSAADWLLDRGVRNVVVTLGARGALLKNNDTTIFQPAKPVTVVDSTGAGDTFNGYFAAMLANGKSLAAALEIAVGAATTSVQSAGAIASIPRLGE